MDCLNKHSITLAVIPGTTFKKYLYSLIRYLALKGVHVKVISVFRFHLVEARQAGIAVANSGIDRLFSVAPDDSITDSAIDLDTVAFRRMFRYKNSYRTLYRKLVPWYRQLFKEGGIEGLLVFNGSKIYQRAAICAAEKEGLRVVYLENGYLPRTMQIDSRGINCNNSLEERYALAKESIEPRSYEELRSYARNSICTEGVPHGAESSSKKGLEWWWSIGMDLLVDPILRPWIWRPAIPAYLRAKRRGKSFTRLGGALPASYLLLILQVECDSQHVLHSPLFQSMREAIRICAEARDEVAPGLPIVVRPHPAEPRPWLALEKLDELTEISWDEITPLEEALDGAEVVCTINSSVGFQALMAGKRVFALGEACYALPAVCPSAVDCGSASVAMRAAMALDVNNAERMKFLTFATKEYFVYDSWVHLTPSGLERTSSRIYEELVRDPSPRPASPPDFNAA